MGSEVSGQRVGSHHVRTEAGVSFIKVVGVFTLDDTRAIASMHEQILAQYGVLYVIADLREASGFSPEGRKFLAEWNRRHTVTAIAQFGGSLLARTISNLVVGATRLLGGHVPMIKNVKDEDEARTFIAAFRRSGTNPR